MNQAKSGILHSLMIQWPEVPSESVQGSSGGAGGRNFHHRKYVWSSLFCRTGRASQGTLWCLLFTAAGHLSSRTAVDWQNGVGWRFLRDWTPGHPISSQEAHDTPETGRESPAGYYIRFWSSDDVDRLSRTEWITEKWRKPTRSSELFNKQPVQCDSRTNFLTEM